MNAKEDNGWIEWKGGKRPVAGDTRVNVKLRSGFIDDTKSMAGGWDWRTEPPSKGNIIAYRVVAP